MAAQNSVVLMIDWRFEKPFPSWKYHVIQVLELTGPFIVKFVKMQLNFRCWNTIGVLKNISFYKKRGPDNWDSEVVRAKEPSFGLVIFIMINLNSLFHLKDVTVQLNKSDNPLVPSFENYKISSNTIFNTHFTPVDMICFKWLLFSCQPLKIWHVSRVWNGCKK